MHRSTSDIGSKVRLPESSGAEQAQHHDQASFAPGSRAPMSVGPLDQSAFHSGEKIVLQKYVSLLFASPDSIPSYSGLGWHGTVLRTHESLVLWRLVWGWVSLFKPVQCSQSLRAGSTTLSQSVREQGRARL